MLNNVSTLSQRITKLYRFLAFISRRLIVDGGIYQASVLTFTTLLAIVPLMSVSFALLSAFPFFHQVEQQIQNFIFEHFVPATGHTVQIYLQQFVKQAASLSVGGLLFLVVTAVAMMYTIEQVLNTIWQVKQRRYGIAAILLYWAVLTLGPMLMGLSLLVSSYLATLPIVSESVLSSGVIATWLLAGVPFILTVFAFAFLYIVVPNTKVSFYYGILGALMSSVLFEVAKYLFTLYVKQFHTYELLYGAFSTIPIFLLWLYIVWVIVLLGAEITHALSAHYLRRLGPRLDPFTHTICWLRKFWHAQQQGKGCSLATLIQDDPYDYELAPRDVLQYLIDTMLVCQMSNGEYILARELSKTRWDELCELLPWKIPTLNVVSLYDALDLPAYRQQLASLEAATKASMQQSVTVLFG